MENRNQRASENEKEYKKVYVNVTALMRTDGQIRPLYFKWTDGNTYEFDRIVRIERAASLKVGGYGLRYTVMVEGKERYFFLEDGKWFVEAEVRGGVA